DRRTRARDAPSTSRRGSAPPSRGPPARDAPRDAGRAGSASGAARAEAAPERLSLRAEDAGGEEERVRLTDRAGPDRPVARRLDRTHRDRRAHGRAGVGWCVVAGIVEGGRAGPSSSRTRTGNRPGSASRASVGVSAAWAA